MSKNEIARSVERPKFSSRVDVIVPFHGQYERVTRLIESLFRCTLSNVCQFILVDDASPNVTYMENLAKLSDLECVRLDKQLGFGGAIKAGFEHSEKLNLLRIEKEMPEHAYVVFIQSDCVVEDVGWLSALGNAMLDLKPKGVRMVGSRTNNPISGDVRQEGLKNVESEHVILEDTYLAMHCFMVHRQLFENVGGFIKEYPYGNYEDEEFAYRLRSYGFKQAIAANSFVRHAGGASFKDVYRKNIEARQSAQKNRILCIEDIKRLRPVEPVKS